MDRQELKRELDWFFGCSRPRICLSCGKHFGVFDLHEGIVSRQDVRGWKSAQKQLIMTEFNCIPLHHTCNLDNPPSREAVWEYQKAYYGRDDLMDWYTSLPWKSGKPPRNF